MRVYFKTLFLMNGVFTATNGRNSLMSGEQKECRLLQLVSEVIRKKT